VYDLASSETRQITFGEGSNESPAYSPNGRHIAFASTRGRGGATQIYTMARDGKNVKQITRDGNNYTPSWSN
jgi:TolB protein